MPYIISVDKVFFVVVFFFNQKQFTGIFFLFLHKNICCGYSLEVPRGTSNEHPQHMFSWRNKKNIHLDTPVIRANKGSGQFAHSCSLIRAFVSDLQKSAPH